MEVKIGIQNVVREVVLDVDETAEHLAAKIADAIADGGILNLSDNKGRHVVVPVATLAYVDFGGGVAGHVGFRS